MREKSRISFGPGAASLILIVIILSMSVLGILSLMNSRNDLKLSERSINVIEAVYQLYDEAEREFASLDATVAKVGKAVKDKEEYLPVISAALPEGMTMNGNTISWNKTDGFRSLDLAVEVLPLGNTPRIRWTEHRLTAVTEDIWN